MEDLDDRLFIAGVEVSCWQEQLRQVWSSSHEERIKIIQEGLLNPSADILEAMTETKAIASKPMESLEQIATFDVEKLLSKSATLSENLLLKLRQSLTKEWGTGSVHILPKDFVQKLLTEGLTLIELATHLEEKAARLKCESLEKIKIALAGCNTSSLIDTLEGAFGSIDQETISLVSIPKVKETVMEDVPSTPSPTDCGPVEVELVFPTQAIPLVIAGIPESLLPICKPEAQSCYKCQFTDCTQIFLQEAAACTHVHHDHLNVALACLYCSGRDNPKMWWFSASAWEKHIHKHSQDGLPLFPDDPAFTQLSPETLPSISGSTPKSLPLEDILERAKAAKQCLEEESKALTSLKQGPIKKSKKQRDE